MPYEPLRDDRGVAKFRHEVIAAVLRVAPLGGPRLQVLVWPRAREPFTGELALPSGPVEVDETMDAALERHLGGRHASGVRVARARGTGREADRRGGGEGDADDNSSITAS